MYYKIVFVLCPQSYAIKKIPIEVRYALLDLFLLTFFGQLS